MSTVLAEMRDAFKAVATVDVDPALAGNPQLLEVVMMGAAVLNEINTRRNDPETSGMPTVLETADPYLEVAHAVELEADDLDEDEAPEDTVAEEAMEDDAPKPYLAVSIIARADKVNPKTISFAFNITADMVALMNSQLKDRARAQIVAIDAVAGKFALRPI